MGCDSKGQRRRARDSDSSNAMINYFMEYFKVKFIMCMQQWKEKYLVHPDLLPQLASDVAQTFDLIEAICLQTTVTKHSEDLSIL